MPPGFGSLLSLDKYEIGKTINQFAFTHKAYGKIYQGLARWGNDKGGYFTPTAAAAASAFIKMNIRTGGAKLPVHFAGTSIAWQEEKELGVGTLYNTPFRFTGAMHDAVGVINRREGSARRMVVGINRNIRVPKIGFAGARGSIRIVDYAEMIETGLGQHVARPIMSVSIMVFIAQVFPTLGNEVRKSLKRTIKKYFEGKDATTTTSTNAEASYAMMKAMGLEIKSADRNFDKEDRRDDINGVIQAMRAHNYDWEAIALMKEELKKWGNIL